MQRLLGGPPLSNKELLRRLLAVDPIGASAATVAAEATAAAEAKAAAEFTAAGGGNGSPGMNGLRSGSAPAIESVLRGRLQGSGHSGASGIANLAALLPTARGIVVVLTFLQDPEGGLSVGSVAAALYQAFEMSAEAAVTGVLAASAPSPLRPDTATEASRQTAANGGQGGLGIRVS